MTDCILSCGSIGFSAHRFLLVSGEKTRQMGVLLWKPKPVI